MGASLSIDDRLNLLETRMTALEPLPNRIDRLESQFLQFRQEMRDEFSAMRVEMAARDDETRRVLRVDIRDGNVLIVTALTEQIEDSRRYARVLFEDAVGRVALVGEGLAALSGRVNGLATRLSIQIERTDAGFGGLEARLSQKIDRTDAKLDMVLARLDRSAGDQH